MVQNLTEYVTFIGNVKEKTGINLSLYKEAQMKRRITSLCEKNGFRNFEDFYQLVHTDKDELFSNKRRLKIWSVACWTGDEPYSLSMV